jgi:hypothetical protein
MQAYTDSIPNCNPTHAHRVSKACLITHYKNINDYPDPDVACTTLVPSTNRVRNIRFAFWNMPSFKLTTMNCDPLKRVLNRRPIFCVWDRSSAASTSSRMYIGAGLNWRRAMIRDSAISDLRDVSACVSGEYGRAHTFGHHLALLVTASTPFPA